MKPLSVSTVTKVGDEIQVAYTNPVYFANAYRNDDTSGAAAALKSLETALGNAETYGTGDKQLTAKRPAQISLHVRHGVLRRSERSGRVRQL